MKGVTSLLLVGAISACNEKASRQIPCAEVEEGTFYIDAQGKIAAYDAEVKKVLQAQRLLATTFTNARNEVISAQEAIASQASGL